MKILKETKGSRLVTFVDEFAGKEYLHIRQQYKKADMKEFKNTKKGISIPIEDIVSLKELYRFIRSVLRKNK